MSHHVKFHEQITTDSALLDLLLILQPRTPQCLLVTIASLVQNGRGSSEMWAWSNFFTHDHVFGPPNLHHVPTPMLCSYGPKTCNFYKCSMRSYKGSMRLFRTLVLTNEITVFITSRIYCIVIWIQFLIDHI